MESSTARVAAVALVAETFARARTDKSNAFPLRHAQILMMLWFDNQAEMAAAELAARKACDPRIRTLAQKLLEAGQRLASELEAARVKLDVEPFAGQAQERVRPDLAALEGPAFDATYLEAQEKAWSIIVGDLERLAIPSAKRPDVLDLARRARDAAAANLQEARRLRAS